MGWPESEWAVRQEAGGIAGKAVLLVLAEACKNASCFLSHETIAKRAEMGRRTVLREMKALELRGLITRTRRANAFGQRTSDLIQLNVSGGRPQSTRAGATSALVGQGDIYDVAKAPNKTSLSANLAQEPVCEPVIEPRISQRLPAQISRDLPAGFPDLAAQQLIAERYSAAGIPIDANTEAERFRDYHLSHGTQSADWSASLRMWISNGIAYAAKRDRPPARVQRTPQRAGGWSAFDEQIEQIVSELSDQ